MIKKIMTLTIFSLLFIITVNAQGKRPSISKEEFREKQQQYLMNKADLTKDEAARFFPVYFEMQDRKAEINNKAWRSARKGKDPNTSDEEYEAIIDELANAKLNSDQLEISYIPKFKNIISPRKLYKIQVAETKFHREMLKIMHQPPRNK